MCPKLTKLLMGGTEVGIRNDLIKINLSCPGLHMKKGKNDSEFVTPIKTEGVIISISINKTDVRWICSNREFFAVL